MHMSSANFVAIILGSKWHSEPVGVRAAYKRMAADVKDEFMRRHPGYQYRPRRPEEKKRRAKRGKASTITIPMSVDGQQD